MMISQNHYLYYYYDILISNIWWQWLVFPATNNNICWSMENMIFSFKLSILLFSIQLIISVYEQCGMIVTLLPNVVHYPLYWNIQTNIIPIMYSQTFYGYIWLVCDDLWWSKWKAYFLLCRQCEAWLNICHIPRGSVILYVCSDSICDMKENGLRLWLLTNKHVPMEMLMFLQTVTTYVAYRLKQTCMCVASVINYIEGKQMKIFSERGRQWKADSPSSSKPQACMLWWKVEGLNWSCDGEE